MSDAICHYTTRFDFKVGYPYTQKDDAMYRLFIDQYGFDVDLDNILESPPVWWCLCVSKHQRAVILKNLSLPWSRRSIEERFTYSMCTISESPDDFLDLVGLESNDIRFVSLRGKMGSSALHHVAYQLEHNITREKSSERLLNIQNWAKLGTELLKTGLDPHHIDATGVTALGLCIGHIIRTTLPMDLLCFCKFSQDAIGIWTSMVQDAGLDLHAYIERENTIFGTIKLELLSYPSVSNIQWVQVAGIEFLADSSRWTIKVLRSTSLCVYNLISCPGAFESDLWPSSTICWPPSTQENDEGYWKCVKTVETAPELVKTHEISEETPDSFTSLVEETQDDTGAVLLLASRWSMTSKSSKTRSSSSPPLISRRLAAYSNFHQSPTHRWLPAYHLCPWKSQCRSGCYSENKSFGRPPDFRHCTKSALHFETSLHDSYEWRSGSFLVEVGNRQRKGAWEGSQRMYSIYYPQGSF